MRSEIADRQRQLLEQVLLGQPEGRDLRTEKDLLLHKRKDNLFRTWSEFQYNWDERLEAYFLEYSRSHPLPVLLSSIGDGLNFCSFLDSCGISLPLPVRYKRFYLKLSYRTRGSVVIRKKFALGIFTSWKFLAIGLAKGGREYVFTIQLSHRFSRV